MANWQILNPFKFNPEDKSAPRDLIKNLLSVRGVKGKKEIEDFLDPNLDGINLKSLGMSVASAEKAHQRIKLAIKNKERIVIYTDYDADGICAGAILWETLYGIKADVLPFVPNRLTEGYGLSEAGIDKIKKETNPKIIITVDHGITKVREVEYARRLGIEVIIIDHHLAPEKLPEAVAIIHTIRLCATGVTWVFCNFIKAEIQTKFLDLVALATVADLVPLIGANRALVKFGLEQINKTKRVGLNVLIELAGLKKGEIDTYSLSHVLAPRINASGRLTNALDSLRLICTKDKNRAEDLAARLNAVNKNRQSLTKESTSVAITQVIETEKIIFASDTSFHQGIIGLIAGKLVESYKRPAIVVSVGEEYCKASVRSVRGINIVEFLQTASELLIDVGGHPMAAGFTVHKDNLQKLKTRLFKFSRTLIAKENLVPDLLVDLELDPAYANNSIYAELESLAPFGQGNPQPVFAGLNLSVIEARLVGKEKNHLKLILSSEKNPDKFYNAIGFNLGELYNSLPFGIRIDIAYQLNKDTWNGESRLILKLKDARLSG